MSPVWQVHLDLRHAVARTAALPSIELIPVKLNEKIQRHLCNVYKHFDTFSDLSPDFGLFSNENYRYQKILIELLSSLDLPSYLLRLEPIVRYEGSEVSGSLPGGLTSSPLCER